LDDRGYGLEVTEAARNEIANRGYDPAMGARPLKRVIQNELQNPLATELLKGQFPEDSTIKIDYDGTDFTFTATGVGNGAARRGKKKSPGDEIIAAEVV
jgi:ATP-dependent Clp protease ATP-binding subunit ClpB